MDSEKKRASDSVLTPLEGEASIPSVAHSGGVPWSPTVAVAVVVFVLSLGFAGYAAIHSMTKESPKAAEEKAAKKGPVAAASQSGGKKFDLTKVPDGAPAVPEPVAQNALLPRTARARDRAGAVGENTEVPGIETDASGSTGADPIGVRASRTNAQNGSATYRQAKLTAPVSPFDSSAALPLVSSTEVNSAPSVGNGSADPATANARARLADLQDTAKGLMGTLSKLTNTPPQSAPSPAAPALPLAGLGGQLVGSKTPRVSAGWLGDRSLTMPKGTTFTCALKTRIVSEQSGFVSCQVLRNVYSDDGRVLLVDRGSHMDGEYQAKYRQGQTRIFVVWTRVRTPNGVSIDVESPATGALGEAGVDGYVDNHWTERFGSAMLLTMIDDAVKIGVAKQQSGAATIVSQDGGGTMSKVVEKMLDNTINIPPTIFKNQGEVIGIYVAKDVDFSSVYALRTAER